MQRALGILALFIAMTLPSVAHERWHHRGQRWQPAPQYFMVPAPTYRTYEYRQWNPGYTVRYCTPEQGQPVYDQSGRLVACVRYD